MQASERAEKERQTLIQEARDACARRVSHSSSIGSSDSAMRDLNFALKRIKAMPEAKLLERAEQRDKASQPLDSGGRFRLDEWTCISPAPTAVPFELKPKGSTFRGMQDLEAARQYAQDVVDFFHEHGLKKNVFVVKGPTSTTKCAFEVVTETSIYPVVHAAKCEQQPSTTKRKGP